MYNLTLEQAKALSAEYKSLPISTSIYSDMRTPIEVLRVLKRLSKHCYILESLEDQSRWGRYTFLGYDPKLELTCKDGEMTIKGGTTMTIKTNDPARYIRDIADQNKAPRLPDMPPFAGGLVGYFSYDYIKYAEPTLNLDAEDEEGFRDVDLMLFDKVIAFDNLAQKIILIVNIKTDELEENYQKAKLELKTMAELVRNGIGAEHEPLRIKSEFRALFDKQGFCDMVNKAKDYIYEGDIFRSCFPTDWKQTQREACLIHTEYSERQILLRICSIFPVTI